jgi:hypothetical protein
LVCRLGAVLSRLQNGAFQPSLEPRPLNGRPLGERFRDDCRPVEQGPPIESEHVLDAIRARSCGLALEVPNIARYDAGTERHGRARGLDDARRAGSPSLEQYLPEAGLGLLLETVRPQQVYQRLTSRVVPEACPAISSAIRGA